MFRIVVWAALLGWFVIMLVQYAGTADSNTTTSLYALVAATTIFLVLAVFKYRKQRKGRQ